MMPVVCFSCYIQFLFLVYPSCTALFHLEKMKITACNKGTNKVVVVVVVLFADGNKICRKNIKNPELNVQPREGRDADVGNALQSDLQQTLRYIFPFLTKNPGNCQNIFLRSLLESSLFLQTHMNHPTRHFFFSVKLLCF